MLQNSVAREGADTLSTRLDDLYVRHFPGMFQLAYLLTGRTPEAEDLAQEAFIRAAGRFRHLRDQGTLHAYLRRAVVNQHISGLRRLRRERSTLVRVEAGDLDESPRIEEHESLWPLVLDLPARQRAAIVLRYYEDLSERQTAEVLRCSISAVKSLVARGIGSLRDQMRSEDK